MPVKKIISQKPKTVKQSTVQDSGGAKASQNDILSVVVYSMEGVEDGKLNLPEEVFGTKVNKSLLAQALRVYLNNQKTHFAHTKTRGEISFTTAKWYKQKGTGRARHGAKSAPIFVHGGVALGPKYRKVELELPKKMKQKALISALSQKASEMGILGVSGLEKVVGKTREMGKLVAKVHGEASGKRKFNILFVTGEKQDNVVRAVRNMIGVEVISADQINAHEVISHRSLVLTAGAVARLQEKFSKQEESV